MYLTLERRPNALIVFVFFTCLSFALVSWVGVVHQPDSCTSSCRHQSDPGVDHAELGEQRHISTTAVELHDLAHKFSLHAEAFQHDGCVRIRLSVVAHDDRRSKGPKV